MEDQILLLSAEKAAFHGAYIDQANISQELRKQIFMKDQKITKLVKELEDIKKSLEVSESSTT